MFQYLSQPSFPTSEKLEVKAWILEVNWEEKDIDIQNEI